MCSCIPENIERALADLPMTLDETYQRTLREIKEAHWEFAHRLFQFVEVACHPLRVEELSELLAFDFKVGSIPKFHEDWRLQDAVDAVLSTCSSLLAIVDGYRHPFGTVKLVQFSHFSAREYLTSARLAETSDTISRRYHVSTIPAHTLAAQACLGILLHFDKDLDHLSITDSLAKWPLAKYAAEYWVNHARFEGVLKNVEDGMKQLFDPKNPHLAVCISIHDPCEQNRPSGRLLPPPGTPLHYAAIWGLHFIVEFLIVEHSQNVHSRDFTGDATPLHLASSFGHTEATRILIEHGADVTAQNTVDETPLHLASQNGHDGVARVLIERSAGVAAQNNHGETPLHLASRSGEVEFVRMLIERGAEVEARNKDGETPLHLASRTGLVEVARMLIERGADVAALNKDGETALHLALRNRTVEVAWVLIERGADVAAQSYDGETPLHLASRNGLVEVADMLIERGACVAVRNKHGETPLHTASRDGQEQAARLLIEHGADVGAQNAHGETPLCLALALPFSSFREEQVEVARMLIERGAKVADHNKDGKTPLHLA